MYFDEIEPGMKIDVAPAKIDKDKMLDFAINYDNIPLHTDEQYAAKTHFGKLIAPGVMSFMAVWSKYLESDIFGDELLAGKSTKIEWFKPVFAGDILKADAEVTGKTVRNEKNGIIEISMSIYSQNGELVMTNVTEAIVKRQI